MGDDNVTRLRSTYMYMFMFLLLLGNYYLTYLPKVPQRSALPGDVFSKPE